MSGAEAHKKQKALKRERQASKANADVVQRAKKIWERLRVKTNIPKEERNELLQELAEIIKGRTKELVYKHDTVRIIQTALKYGSLELRTQVAEELEGEYRGLAESKYAKFLVAKLITECDQKIKDMIIHEFYGHVRKLINHPEASWIVDDIYRQVAKQKQKAAMLMEWYGPEFSIFKKQESDIANADLSQLLKENPEKRKPIMDSLHSLINQLVQKKLTGFTMLHDAMLQYYLNVVPGSSEAEDFLKLMIGDKNEEEIDLMKNLSFTKPGSRLVCLALANGTPKDRRQLLRAFKNTVRMMATDKNGHLVLLTALDVVDDTREIASRIFSELVDLTKSTTPESQHERVLALADHSQGHTVLLYPFAGAAKWLLPLPAWQQISEVRKIRETSSKKDPKTRQQELSAAISPPVFSTIAQHAEALSKSPFGFTLMQEALLSGAGDKAAAITAVAALAAGDPETEGHIAQSASGGKMLKTLVLGGYYSHEEKRVIPIEPPLGFHNALYAQIKDHVVSWACGGSSLVVAGLLEAGGFEHQDELRAALTKAKEQLKSAAAGAEGGVDAKVDKPAANQGKRRVKSKKTGDEGSKGNKGAQVILERLNE